MILYCATKDRDFSRKGFSLAEAAIVLFVIGAILASLWSMVSNVQQSARIEYMGSLISQTVFGVRDVYKAYLQTPAGDLTHAVISFSAVPDELIRRRSSTPYTAGHLWDSNAAGGSFQILASTTDQSAYFDLQLTVLPQSVCIKLAELVSSDTGVEGLETTKINATAAVAGGISPEIAAGSCNSATNNTIRLVYRLRQKGL